MNEQRNDYSRAIRGDTAGQATKAPSVPAVHTAQESLDKATNNLHSMLESLESRLGPILAAVPTSGNNISESPPPPHNIASRINSSADAVNAAARRVSYLLERLEV